MVVTPKAGSLENRKDRSTVNETPPLSQAISNSWEKIAPFWPLKNLVAVNPIAGFENLPFEEALRKANAFFQQQVLPAPMEDVNRESIKWLQAFFDQGQSTISMPLRNKGFLKSTLSLIHFDKKIHSNDKQKIKWLQQLPHDPEAVISKALHFLGIKPSCHETFLTLMLTTLPGWAAHIQYRANWTDARDKENDHPVTGIEYLAFRSVLTCLIWPQATELLAWHRKALERADTNDTYSTIVNDDNGYQQRLLKQLNGSRPPQKRSRPEAQLVFCIDVRSEPFRRALEATGNYETLGFAGFFGVPVSIGNAVTAESYASCPVLLKPAYHVEEYPANCSHRSYKQGYRKFQGIMRLYQSLKYTFAAPFGLVETIGLTSGLWMAIRSISPKGAAFIQSLLRRRLTPAYPVIPDLTGIPFPQQVEMAASALKLMGLTETFAPVVVFCGHGSTSENNAYGTALDCGACGGRHGEPNARILAKILNDERVRSELEERRINIPDDTIFVAAAHNTTTDEVKVYDGQLPDTFTGKMLTLKNDLERARNNNCIWRATQLEVDTAPGRATQRMALRAIDWAQVRPEWGLAGNAAFIAGPRWLTKDCDLQGRAFLHSYEWEKDKDSSSLKTILTAPMVVAQWINAQYLFSTLDNVAFGGGSKITTNITGKIGIMQGNASDLMHGLPLQSVFTSDDDPYHKPLRLTVVVYAPAARIGEIVEQHDILRKLFGNGWVHLICYDPKDQKIYKLTRTLTWTACTCSSN
ncbi:MAG: DUF2309 domain-containing protein [Bacteroidetes bacterium]|nr:DUF2309 domain-containing protein [Bacteroidota bacterium]